TISLSNVYISIILTSVHILLILSPYFTNFLINWRQTMPFISLTLSRHTSFDTLSNNIFLMLSKNIQNSEHEHIFILLGWPRRHNKTFFLMNYFILNASPNNYTSR